MKNSELGAQLVDSFDGPLTLGSRRCNYQKAVDERETGVSRLVSGFVWEGGSGQSRVGGGAGTARAGVEDGGRSPSCLRGRGF